MNDERVIQILRLSNAVIFHLGEMQPGDKLSRKGKKALERLDEALTEYITSGCEPDELLQKIFTAVDE
jgi:hypothetical protein